LFDLNLPDSEYEITDVQVTQPTAGPGQPTVNAPEQQPSLVIIAAAASVAGAVVLVGLFLLLAWKVPSCQRRVFPAYWKTKKTRPNKFLNQHTTTTIESEAPSAPSSPRWTRASVPENISNQ